ncbi:MAG: hypothetical protein N4A72_10835 [Bacteroidales bacterium]|jgi:hypothetical protein|nr:hypothetical protein [Bacteroidales bacterium]
MSKEYKGQLSAAEIAELKAKHKDIFQYKVDGKICYLRDVTIDDIDYAQTVKKSNIGFKMMIIDSIWLAGCEEIRSNKRYKLGLSSFVSDLIEIEVGELDRL